jgi:hypothetical protein
MTHYEATSCRLPLSRDCLIRLRTVFLLLGILLTYSSSEASDIPRYSISLEPELRCVLQMAGDFVTLAGDSTPPHPALRATISPFDVTEELLIKLTEVDGYSDVPVQSQLAARQGQTEAHAPNGLSLKTMKTYVSEVISQIEKFGEQWREQSSTLAAAASKRHGSVMLDWTDRPDERDIVTRCERHAIVVPTTTVSQMYLRSLEIGMWDRNGRPDVRYSVVTPTGLIEFANRAPAIWLPYFGRTDIESWLKQLPVDSRPSREFKDALAAFLDPERLGVRPPMLETTSRNLMYLYRRFARCKVGERDEFMNFLGTLYSFEHVVDLIQETADELNDSDIRDLATMYKRISTEKNSDNIQYTADYFFMSAWAYLVMTQADFEMHKLISFLLAHEYFHVKFGSCSTGTSAEVSADAFAAAFYVWSNLNFEQIFFQGLRKLSADDDTYVPAQSEINDFKGLTGAELPDLIRHLISESSEYLDRTNHPSHEERAEKLGEIVSRPSEELDAGARELERYLREIQGAFEALQQDAVR